MNSKNIKSSVFEENKIGPDVLFGVRDFRSVSKGGEIEVETHLMRLRQGSFGFMADQTNILYFRSRSCRDDFIQGFGGTSLTLTRKKSEVKRYGDQEDALRRLHKS